ncbi:MAG: hypothetical protein J6Y37_01390 [Paludibacteraceae bacterium]|nr:hypothetical protein [Paludibacteraceae bacterium]
METVVYKTKWDSLTPAQKSVIRKTFELLNDTTVEDEVPFNSQDIFTPEEFDAKMELSVKFYNLNNLQISENVFRRRIKEIFGYEKVSDIDKHLLWQDLSENTVSMRQPNDFEEFWISQSSRAILPGRMVNIRFADHRDIQSYEYKSDEYRVGNYIDTTKIYAKDIYAHYNNYIFNGKASSGVWLLLYEKYFMYHLVMNFGYDGDSALCRAFLRDYLRGGDYEVFDMPFTVVHFYPDGRHKILDGVLQEVAELSTSDNSSCFDWAENELYRYAGTASKYASSIEEEEEDDDEDRYIDPMMRYAMRLDSSINALSFKDRCEIVAHITNYIYPVFLEHIDGNPDYGDVSMHARGIDIPTSFWNAIFRDHELFYEINRNDGYDLPHLQELLMVIRSDDRFYDKDGKLAPWELDLSAGLESATTEEE